MLLFHKSKPLYYFFPQSFFAVWAIMRAGHLSTRSILPPLLFVMCILFFRYVSGLFECKDNMPEGISLKRMHITALIISSIFTLLYLLADSATLTQGLSNPLFCMVILTASALGLFFLFYNGMLLLLHYAAGMQLKEAHSSFKFLPLAGFFLCLICWLPYFLYEYPGIMSPDSINQFEQVLGMVPQSNAHPWVHTMLIGLLYRIGLIFTDDVTAAISFYTIFQMCFMAACVSWLIRTLQRFRISNVICIAVLAFYAFIPYHAVLSVTIWKDVMFSGAILLFTTALLRILFLFAMSTRKQKLFTLIIYALSGLMMCLFRNNGWYAFLLSFPFIVYTFRHSLKLLLPLQLGILAAALLIRGPVMTAYQINQPDFVESLCIPIQHIARVICDDKELTDEEWELVHKVIDTTYIKELYSPGFADNMKELVRAGDPVYLTEHKSDYLKLWITLGLRYPATYLQAQIDQTVGYWYPDVEYTVADIDGVIANDTGVEWRPLISGPLVVKTKEILLKLGNILPLYGLLFSMGAMFWALICCIGITSLKRQYRKYILFLPGLAVILTLFIATPVSSEFRYAYSLAYVLPLYLLIPFLPENQGLGQNNYNTLDKNS